MKNSSVPSPAGAGHGGENQKTRDRHEWREIKAAHGRVGAGRVFELPAPPHRTLVLAKELQGRQLEDSTCPYGGTPHFLAYLHAITRYWALRPNRNQE